MKKLLAVIMSIVMAFSIAVVPASAAEEEITIDEFFTAVETSIALIEDTITQIHYIVGTILGVLGKECPMCAEVHVVETEEDADDELVEDEIIDSEVELPEENTEAVA